LLATMEQLIAEVPAARALKEISAERGHVADLRRRRVPRRLRERAVTLLDRRVIRQFRQRHQRPERQPGFVVVADEAEVRQIAAAVGTVAGSPMPAASVELRPQYCSMRWHSITGISFAPAILYCSRLGLTINPVLRSRIRFSKSA